MLREFQITNFKAFAGPETIPIRPITLIFGPNSSGKSSIFQCLLMLKQTIESSDTKTNLLIKGDLIDLGSYREFIYRHETERSFSFKATITSGSAWPNIAEDVDWFNLDIRQDIIENMIQEYNVLALSITLSYDLLSKNTHISGIELFTGDGSASLLKYEEDPKNNSYFTLSEAGTCKIKLDRFLPKFPNGNDLHRIKYDSFRYDEELLTPCTAIGIEEILKTILYIGPMREYPERFFSFSGNQTNYVGKSGKFVPDILITDKELLAKVNNWFDRLEMGYELKIASLNDFSSDLQELFALRLYSKPSGVHVGITDVGFGISQVLPVIVQSVLAKGSTVLIEQPEYHLHPRLQAEIGDLFIESALDRRNNFIIETHSEHLILRILKRIRQTSEGELPEGLTPITPADVSVIYIYPMKDGSGSKVVQIPVTEDGDFAVLWPDGFFSERARELM